MAPLSFDLAPTDVEHFVRTVNQPAVRAMWHKNRWILAGLCGVMLLYDLLLGNFCGMLMMAVIVLCAFFVLPAIGLRLAEQTFQKAANDPAMRARYYGAYTLTMDEDGFALSGPIGTLAYRWSALLRVQLTDTHLVVVLVGNSGIAIPRAAIGDDATREALAYLKAHCLLEPEAAG